MQEISYLEAMAQTTERMSKGGVFLTVEGERPNTMTIGWGSVGFYWRKPVFTVIVRPQRHTYRMLLEAGEFTVSVPTSDPLKEQLAFAGSHSGRDVDKFAGHGLTAVQAQRVKAPIVAECGLHFECRTLMTCDMPEDTMDAEILASCYPNRDLHTMFFGEILACYTTAR